jgi:hypothetical protein
MKQVLAIARLTFWEGIRMRIVLVFLIVLGFVVLRLPFALRGDETLAGRLQTFLSYSLTALGVFMSLATIFFSCATLSEEIRTRTLHMVVTKPISRFQILLGKWIGVNGLNLLICVMSGSVIYGLAYYVKSQPELFSRDRVKIDEVVWTSRLAAPPTSPDFNAQAEKQITEREQAGEAFLRGRRVEVESLERELREAWRQVEPGTTAIYRFADLPPPATEQERFQVRFRLRALPFAEFAPVTWGIVDAHTGELLDFLPTRERPEEIHQFLVRAENWVKDGKSALAVNAPFDERYPLTLYFEGDESLQILYRVGSFEVNFTKVMLLILFRLAFLSALGVFFGTFVSFPVACFCVLSVFLFCLGTPFWLESIGANMGLVDPNVDPYGALGPFVRALLVPVLKIALPNFIRYDGISALIDGYYIDWRLLGAGALHTLGYGVALLLLPGWLIFRSREVAEVVV